MIRALSAGALTVVTLSALLTGCGEDAEPAVSDNWPPSTDPVDRSGIVYADGSRVHLGDGSTIDAGTDIGQFVLAGDGAYFVAASDGTAGALHLATPDGVEETGAEAEARSLHVSPDGRYLAFLDLTTGEKDGFGTPVATTVVVDLEEGREITRSAEGMGDPDGGDDLLDLYEDADPGIVAVTDDTAYVDTPDGVLGYDLANGDGERVADDYRELTDEDWYPLLVDPGPVTNEAGTWTIQNRYDGGAPRLVPQSGPPVRTQAPVDLWSLSRWLDDSTVLGAANADPSGESGSVLLTCTVPSGRCSVVPGTEDGVLLPAN